MTNRNAWVRCLVLGAAILLAITSGVPASAEEEAQLTPAERFRAVVEKLPEPSPEQGYSFTGTLYMGEIALGEFRFSAAAEVRGERKFWKTEESARLAMGEMKLITKAISLLDSHLAGVNGTVDKSERGVASRTRWARTQDGYRIFLKTEGEDEETESLAKGGKDSLPGLASFLLFLKHAPEEPADYESRGFDPDDDDGKYLETISFSAKGRGEWKGDAAILFTRVEPDRKVTIALDPESRAILGMRMERDDGVVLDFLPGEAVVAAEDGDEYTPPGTTPEKAALIIALAYGSANGALLDRMTDWTSVVADLKSRYPGQEFTDVTLRTAIKSRLDAHPNPKGREEMVPVLSMIEPQLEVEMKGDDRATVRFPAVFQNLVLELGKVGSEWRLVVLPGT